MANFNSVKPQFCSNLIEFFESACENKNLLHIIFPNIFSLESSSSVLKSELLRRWQHSDSVTHRILCTPPCTWASSVHWVLWGAEYLLIFRILIDQGEKVGNKATLLAIFLRLLVCFSQRSEVIFGSWRKSLLFPALRSFSTGCLTTEMLTQGHHVYVVFCPLEEHFHAVWPH